MAHNLWLSKIGQVSIRLHGYSSFRLVPDEDESAEDKSDEDESNDDESDEDESHEDA